MSDFVVVLRQTIHLTSSRGRGRAEPSMQRLAIHQPGGVMSGAVSNRSFVLGA
jgi:hypothetical protein